MRYTIAIAAFAGLAAAAPQYGYAEESPAYPAESSSAAEYPSYPVETPSASVEYPVETPEATYPASSMVPMPTESKPAGYPVVPSEVPEYPVESSYMPEVPVYTSYMPEVPASSMTPEVPIAESTACSSSVTVTVTVPYPTGTGYPVVPGSGKPTGGAPYPSVPAGGAPYPSAPVGTGVPVAPPAGTGAPTKTGGYVKPSTPAEFTGAASALNVGGFVAGVGAFAAFFL